MASIKDSSELALLSKQRTTGAAHNVFDATQFKQLVEDDVSNEVIERLQREFGDDMAGAIDEHVRQQESPKKEKNASPQEDGDQKEEDADANARADPLGRKEFVIRDRYWNKIKRRWVIEKPSKSRGDETKKHKNCVIFVRRDYDEDMKSYSTALVISGTILRNALLHIFRGADDFGLTENESTELTPRWMFWAQPELQMLAEHYNSVNDKKASFEINSALNYVASEFEEMISVLPSMLPQSITFGYLWAILPPDCLVAGKNSLDFDSIWCVRSHSVQQTQCGIFLVMNAEYIVWDGEKAGNVRTSLSIPAFNGLKQIRDLPYIPLKYHADRDAIMSRVLERSNKALEFWKPSFSHQEHHGTGLAQVYDKVERYPFSGRVVIDPKMMRQMEPANKVMPRARDISNLRKTSRTCVSDLTSEEEKPKIFAALLESASDTVTSDDDDMSTPSTPLTDTSSVLSKESSTGEKLQLSKEQMLIVSGSLYGYSLRDGTWGAFAVNRVTPISWNSKIFESLVMDESLKDVIYKLVVSHGTGTSKFDDFVKGKGKGLIGLLFGPPGSGKTLTAEAIAETAKMPLYAVSSGALGHEASQIHERLAGILKLASHWKAVLLLDEADVFLAQRTITGIKRNAIVSIFLREIEYYQGILLLTTNQAQVIDEAFQSRIHLFLQYDSLDVQARLKIWNNFMDTVRSTGTQMDINQDSLRSLAEIPLNGRQIKNAVSIAVKIASNDDSYSITVDSLRATVKLLQTTQFADKLSASKWKENDD